ncbi:MAG TPA: 3-oxoacyl-[acyl-carrier-protein] reductase [Gemmatimonadota bacterium]|nr:3-oxoacyl-[acyl-carrier-protein] reductase [Gemmatimonadota bacterium]
MSAPGLDLSGRTALVTGGTRGIGRAVSETLARAGASVIVFARSAEAVGRTAEELAGHGVRTLGLVGDVGDPSDVERAWGEAQAAFEAVDILVNNAGLTRDNLMIRMKQEEWDEVLRVNLGGAFLWSRHALRPMIRRRWGRIINMASVVGVTGNAGQANYAASKAGLIGLSKSLAAEVASRGVTVNVVAPGFIETDMTAGLDAATRAGYEQRIPAGRLGSAKDVAHLVLFLASSLSDYITGQVICVDGGLTR